MSCYFLEMIHNWHKNTTSEFITEVKILKSANIMFFCAVKQREVVRATWTLVTPQTRVRGVALQPWPTVPPSDPSPQREAPQ